MKGLILTAALAASGCSTVTKLLPDSVAPEIEHMSHATQHQPFTDRPTDYGANIANLALNWNVSKHVYVTLAEGVDLDKHYAWANSCGEIMGPREEFTARVGYKFLIRK